MTELNMNLPERALEALGKTRSELTRYKKQNAEQQRRIRELEELLKEAKPFMWEWHHVYTKDGIRRLERLNKRIAAILKG